MTWPLIEICDLVAAGMRRNGRLFVYRSGARSGYGALIDLRDGAAALLLALLVAAGTEVVYIPGRTVNRITDAYRGEGKTHAKDVRIIAGQARKRALKARNTPRPSSHGPAAGST